MTDEEIICTFMEPRPMKTPHEHRPWRSCSDKQWWRSAGSSKDEWIPRSILDLDALREVEARLTDEQWEPYVIALLPVKEPAPSYEYHFLHASAEQKIKALAAVIRPVVEK